ncbi:MAG: hypothetical protein NWE92_04175 [Candidatus Bathyarchaeota archaeon]|nr:hypothetical protein [Candidatus Bathyarchaeota archaeon]
MCVFDLVNNVASGFDVDAVNFLTLQLTICPFSLKTNNKHPQNQPNNQQTSYFAAPSAQARRRTPMSATEASIIA